MEGPRFKKSKVSQTINLKEVFGFDFRGKDSLKELVGQKVLDYMRQRTEAGKAFGGKRDLKAPYSKEYAESLEFKAHGKSKNKVNMKLTGDMLGLMDFKIDGNKLIFGWDDPEENAKAFNHNTGDTVPKRPFFGVNKTEMIRIQKSLKDEIRAALDLKKNESRQAFEDFIGGLIGEIVDRTNKDGV